MWGVGWLWRAEFAGIRLDPMIINARNVLKVGPEYLRKGGILINNGGVS